MSVPFEQKDNEFIAWYPLNLTAEHARNVWAPRRAGYYVHIPFCTAICDYCGFAVDRIKGAPVGSYLDALKREIEVYAESGRLTRHRFVCGHFGGGTPSAIDAAALMEIKLLIDRSFDVTDDAEVTVEVNPISFTPEKAELYRKNGVNRISFGVQSFDDRTLKTLGRPHRHSDVQDTLEVIAGVGFENFSLDLIYGVPGQTVDAVRHDLELAVATGATHISCFRLEIIPMTVLKLREAAGALPPRLATGTLNEMDDLVFDVLTSAGYTCYGAFNFAKPGFESIHNSVAFIAPQGEYIGFGNSAYSFIGGSIFCNYADSHDYMEAVFEGRDPIAFASPVDSFEAMARYFVLGLKFFRVSRAGFIALHGIEPERLFGEILSDLEAKQLLRREGDDYVLTAEGRRYVNNVSKCFFSAACQGRSQFTQICSTLSVSQIEHYSRLRDRGQAELVS